MKRLLVILSVLLLGATCCSQRYELSIPLALNRVDLRLSAAGGTSYVLVYSDGPWTASFGEEVSWVSLSRTSGTGNSQINITMEPNVGFERSVMLTVSNSTGSKEMRIRQQGEADEK